MRGISLAAGLILLSTAASGEEIVQPLPDDGTKISSSTEESGTYQITSSLMPIDEGADLDLLYPKLPIGSEPAPAATIQSTNGATDDKKTSEVVKTDKHNEAGKAAVEGYFLNQQLLTYVARDYPRTGVEIGRGWNSFLNRPGSHICIEGQARPLIGREIVTSVNAVEDSSGFNRAISGSASGSYGMFSGGASYSKTHTFSRYDLNVVLSANIDTGGTYIATAGASGEVNGVRLSPYALDLLKAKDGESRFLQACGDSYVTTIRNGGRVYSLLTVRNVSEAEREKISASASGGFGGFGGSGSFSQDIKTSSGSRRVDSRFEQVGGIIAGIPTSFDDFLEKFSGITVDKDFEYRPYVFYTINYRSLANWPDGMKMRISPVDQEFYSLAYDNFMGLMADYDRALVSSGDYLNFLAGGKKALLNYKDTAMITARILDDVIAGCTENYNCSDDEIINWDEKIAESAGELPIASLAKMGFDASIRGDIPLLLKEPVAVASEKEGEPTASGAPAETPPPVEAAPATGTTTEPDPAAEAADKPEQTKEGTSPTGKGYDIVLNPIAAKHYLLLAGLPLPLKDPATPGGVRNSDFNPNAASEAEIQDNFRAWLVEHRLRPESARYCGRATKHPLCLTEREMSVIVGMLDVDAKALLLRKDPEPIDRKENVTKSPEKKKVYYPDDRRLRCTKYSC